MRHKSVIARSKSVISRRRNLPDYQKEFYCLTYQVIFDRPENRYCLTCQVIFAPFQLLDVSSKFLTHVSHDTHLLD
jgi:hypothetical protein